MVSAEQVLLPVLPRNDLVLLEMEPSEDVSKGGIFLVSGKKSRTGVVRAVGPGALSDHMPAPHRMPMDLAVGDRVHLSNDQCGHEFDAGGERRYVLVPQIMIFGVLPS